MQTIFGTTEPPPDKGARNQMFLGLCIGALSGAITSVVELAADDVGVLRIIGTPYLIGSVFGAVFACWLWVGMGKRSLLKALGFTVACAAAYNAAWFVAVFSGGIFGGGDVQKDSRMIAGSPAGSFFLSGTVGGFIVLAAALFLFSEDRRLLRPIARAAAFSPLGGVFGLAAWGICSILTSPRPASESHNGAFELILLWLVWQSGMGALLGALLVPEHRPNPSTSSAPERRAGIGFKTVRALLILICLASVAYFVLPDIPSEIQAARSQREYKDQLSLRAQRESVEVVRPKAVDDVLITMPFGAYLPIGATVTLGNRSVDPETRKITETRPEWYTVRYETKQDTSSGPNSYVNVAVLEYPTRAWAKQQVEQWNSGLSVDDLPSSNSSRTRVLSNRGITDTSGRKKFVWYSRTYVIVLESSSADFNPVLQAYIAKYPSWL